MAKVRIGNHLVRMPRILVEHTTPAACLQVAFRALSFCRVTDAVSRHRMLHLLFGRSRINKVVMDLRWRSEHSKQCVSGALLRFLFGTAR